VSTEIQFYKVIDTVLIIFLSYSPAGYATR